LLAILEQFCNPNILTDNQPFVNQNLEKYIQPISNTDINYYKNIINNFPDFEVPEIFGMNENANIAY